MVLLSAYELDARTTVFTVLEQWSERRWLRTRVTEREQRYVLELRVRRWHDGERYVLRQDPRHFRLWELFAAWRIEKKLSRAVGIAEPEPLLELNRLLERYPVRD